MIIDTHAHYDDEAFDTDSSAGLHAMMDWIVCSNL